jgi:hypothetical protein
VTLHVPAFVVIGGGDVGAATVRQLLRAVAAGRLRTDRLFVVDRDSRCAAALETDPRVRLEVADWAAWLDSRLDHFTSEDHFVPYHWAPHVLRGWLERQATRAGASVTRGGGLPILGVPYEQATREGDRALSYATWVCPLRCIEPVLCPHTRGPKDWSLARDLDACSRAGHPVDAGIVFRCLHLVYGVGTIPVAEILAARDLVRAGLAQGRRRYLVATASHCHALASTVCVDPAPATR